MSTEIVIILIEFSVAFFVFGYIQGTNHMEDQYEGRELFWMWKHLFNKFFGEKK